jgi:hypothetical protein
MSPSLLLIAECLGLIASQSPQSQIDQSWLLQARAQARPALERYLSVSSELEEQSEFRYEKTAAWKHLKNVADSTSRYKVSRLGNNSLSELHLSSDNPKVGQRIELQGFNDELGYSFELKKKSVDAPYALVNFGHERSYVQAPLHSRAFDELESLVAAIEGRYPIKRLAWDGARELLYARFDITFKDSTEKKEDEVWVDPKNGWRVVEIKYRTTAFDVSVRMDYGREIEGLTFPVSSEMLSKPRLPNLPETIMRGKLVKLDKTNKTPSDFRLSAFGLPEPAGIPTKQRVPNYVWFLTAAISCALLAVVIRFLARRRRLLHPAV